MLHLFLANLIGRELADTVARHRTLAFGRHLIRKERQRAKWRPLALAAIRVDRRSQDSSKGATS